MYHLNVSENFDSLTKLIGYIITNGLTNRSTTYIYYSCLQFNIETKSWHQNQKLEEIYVKFVNPTSITMITRNSARKFEKKNNKITLFF